jgi:hypothetical protein
MTEKENAKREFTTSGEFSEWQKGNLQGDSSHIFNHAGYVPSEDTQLMKLLNRFNIAYDNTSPNAPHNFEQTQVSQMFTSVMGTKVANQAVKDGNISQMKYFTGQQNYNQDSSSIHALMNLRDRMDTDAYIGYMFGHMGNGKSNFAFLMGEIAKRELGYKVYSNVKSVYENGHTDGYINTFGELLSVYAGGTKISEIADIQTMDIDTMNDDILFIFDEGNQEASGYSQDAYDTMENLGKMITLIRKVGGHLIIIGHTGKDIHPHIRRLTTDCIHKVSKKKAKFFDDVENAKGKNLKLEISGIPLSNWDFDTLEISFWDWSMETNEEMKELAKDTEVTQDTGERNMEMFKKYHNNKDITQEDLAMEYDLSKGRVSQILSEMRQKVKAFSNGEK